MALSYAAIGRDSVSLLRFPFRSHIHVFSCEILFISRFKRPSSWFSFHFSFLVIVALLVLVSLELFLVAAIFLRDFVCSHRVVVSICQRCLQCWQVIFFPLSLTYSLSTSSQGCKALCMVISFLVLWSICMSSSLVHFKNGLEYLTRSTVQVFIPLIRFRLSNFVSSNFLALLI